MVRKQIKLPSWKREVEDERADLLRTMTPAQWCHSFLATQPADSEKPGLSEPRKILEVRDGLESTPHLGDEATEAQSNEDTCPRSHNSSVLSSRDSSSSHRRNHDGWWIIGSQAKKTYYQIVGCLFWMVWKSQTHHLIGKCNLSF